MERSFYTIEFRDLTLEAPTSLAKGAHTLLHSVSGWCNSQRVMGLMGPSGAGKTCLLDTISGAALGGRASGLVTFGGMARTEWCRSHTLSYVMQQDVLPLLDTPREAITTSALLRLPPSLPRQSKLDRVEHLLDLLDLQDCADVLIGDNTRGMKGISGGQRRKVAIGIELVKNPAIIFLDEPLTGLDSEMADTVGACLSRLAREEGKTVVMSLHQASRRLYQYVDDLMLMAGGHLVYCGAFAGAQPYLQSLGYSMLPDQTPEEFMTTVLRSWQDQGIPGTAVKAWDPPCKASVPGTIGEADAKAVAGINHLEGSSAVSLRCPTFGQVLVDKLVQAPFWMQLQVLTVRNLRWLGRARSSTLSMLATAAFAGALIGLIYINITTMVDPGLYDRLALLWLVPAAMTFWFNNIAMFEWESKRQLLRREHSTRLYAITPYFVAYCASWACLILIKMALISILYFIAGLQLTAAKFFIFFGVMVLLAYTCDLMGLAIVVLSPGWNAAVAIQSAVALLLLTSTGFLSEDIPSYLRWVKAASYITYSYNAFALNEFQGLVLYDDTGPADVSRLLAESGLVQTDLGLGANVAALAGIMVGVLLLAFISVWLSARLKRI